jgi:hypothetical protein
MLKGDKYFELIKGVMLPKVMRAYKNRNFSFIYLTGLLNKGFALSLTFSFTFILTGLGALSDALFDRRSHDNALMAYDMQSFFQLNRDNAAQ